MLRPVREAFPMSPGKEAMPPQEQREERIRRLEEARVRRPESLAFARLADEYRKAGRLERALETVREGLVRHPAYLGGRVVHARVLQDLGADEEAVHAFEKVLEVDPFNLVALQSLTDIHEARGEGEAARRWAQRLVEAEPLDEDARARLRRLEARAGKGDRMGEQLEGPERRDPDGSDQGAAPRPEPEEDAGPVTSTMAELCMTQGLYGEAIRIYERLLGERPEDPILAQKLESARVLSGRGRSATAAVTAAAEEVGAGGSGAGEVAAGEVTAGEVADTPREADTSEPMTIRAWLADFLAGRTVDYRSDRPRPTALQAWLRGGDG